MNHPLQLSKYSKNFLPIIIILIAFALQMGYLRELRGLLPDSLTTAPFCGVDAIAHWDRATGLLDGSIPGEKVYYFTPLYPFYLAIFKQTWPNNYLLPLIVQAQLQLLGIAALYGLGRLVFSSLAGGLAMLGLATYNYYLYYQPCFDQALLTTPFLTVGLYLILKSQTKDCKLEIRNFSLQSVILFLSGFAFAIAILSRPTVLMTLPAVVGWLGWQRLSWRQFSLNIIALIIPIIVCIAPLTWHNYQVSNKFVLMSDNFGVNLHTGNNPSADGLDTLAHILSQPGVLRFEEVIERIKLGETTYQQEVWRYYQQEPLTMLALNVRKVWLWFGEADKPLVSPYFPLHLEQSTLLSYLPLSWQAMIVVAFLGLIFVRPRSWPRLLLLWGVYGMFSLFTILFFIQLRFRLPFAPFILLQAGALLVMSPQWFQQRDQRYWLSLTVMLILTPLIPGLLLFVIIFIGLAWLTLICRANRHLQPTSSFGIITIAIVLYLSLTMIWIKANTLAHDVSQPITHYLGPKLIGPMIVGQTFEMDCDGFNQLDVTLGKFNDAPHSPITFYLTTDPSSPEILYQETIVDEINADYAIHRLTFPPFNDSQNKSYFFFLASPESTEVNAITVRGYSDTPLDYYPSGQAYVGILDAMEPIQADFAFTATCDMSMLEKLRMVFE